ncbi:hypothetical protein Tco_0140709 [Tanacetum coccineum]
MAATVQQANALARMSGGKSSGWVAICGAATLPAVVQLMTRHFEIALLALACLVLKVLATRVTRIDDEIPLVGIVEDLKVLGKYFGKNFVDQYHLAVAASLTCPPVSLMEKRTRHNVVVWVLPRNSHCISLGYSVAISLVLVLPLGAVLLEVAWSPTLKANDGIGICPLGSRVVVVAVVVVIVVAVVVVIVIAVVVVVICSCRPTPTVLGQVAKLLAVIACWNIIRL